ncbi:MAG: ATP cone domain-containing protein, partial [Candidatus Micrarchaeota archaeon]|nr:ATP cone domain-containing protein [Candidatus Micrarchaeota archaeon]
MALIKQVQKRDGSIVKFDQSKITNAIFKATEAAKSPDMKLSQKVSDRVVKRLEDLYANKIPTVEEIQDIVVEELLKENKKIARLYINYRRERAEIREKKKVLFGVYDDLKLDLNATKVLASRYLQKDISGKIIETPKMMFKRVAKHISEADSIYGEDKRKSEKIFYEMMCNLEFLPNSPTLMNAGTRIGQLSACFVLPIDDSLESIFTTLKNAAIIHQSGGGTGFSFSRIRPKGDLVRSTMSIASGPVSFMRIYDAMTETIKQGGRRRGANMGVLRCDHPDIIEFINSKREGGLRNFNISIAATDKFMKAVEKDDEYELINPRTGEVVKTISA